MADLGDLHLGRTSGAPRRFLGRGRCRLRSMALRGVGRVIGTAGFFAVGMRSRLVRFRFRGFRMACCRARRGAARDALCVLGASDVLDGDHVARDGLIEDLFERERFVEEGRFIGGQRRGAVRIKSDKVVYMFDNRDSRRASRRLDLAARHRGCCRGGNIERVDRANIGIFDHELSQNSLVDAAACDGRGHPFADGLGRLPGRRALASPGNLGHEGMVVPDGEVGWSLRERRDPGRRHDFLRGPLG